MWDTPCTDGRSGLKTKQEPIGPLRTNCTINKCSGTRFWVSQTNQSGTCAFNKSRPTRRVPRDSSPSGSKKGRMIRHNPRWYLCSPQPGIVGVVPHQYFCCLIQITLNLGDLVGLGRVLRGVAVRAVDLTRNIHGLAESIIPFVQRDISEKARSTILSISRDKAVVMCSRRPHL